MPDWESIFKAASTGSDSALARLISAIEGGDFASLSVVGRYITSFDGAKSSPRIGITGAAGAGKSTLVSALSHAWPGKSRVGAIAVDPSSEVSGGAFLGDRFRLYNHHQGGGMSDRLYLRSMGARGSTGALSRYVGAVASLLEVLDFDPVLIETAGAGQSDIAVREWVDCLVLVLNPESGDAIQMLKAGVMEWADIYVVNKADREGADRFASQLRGIVAGQQMGPFSQRVERVHLVQATEPKSSAMVELIDTLRNWNPVPKPRLDLWNKVIEELLEAELVKEIKNRVAVENGWREAVLSCASGTAEPGEIIEQLLRRPGR